MATLRDSQVLREQTFTLILWAWHAGDVAKIKVACNTVFLTRILVMFMT